MATPELNEPNRDRSDARCAPHAHTRKSIFRCFWGGGRSLRWIVLAGAVACGDPPQTRKVAESDSVATPMPAQSAGPSGDAAGMTGDQRFLRWMLDHHAELVTVAHRVLARPDSAVVRLEARGLDDSHDAETIAMRALLQKEYSDSYLPATREEHEAMIAPYAKMPAQALPAAFRSLLAAHHGEAVRAIDSMLPTLANPRVRAIADSMRATRQRDIRVLERPRTSR